MPTAGDNTELHQACADGQLPAVEALLAGGANTQAVDATGKTPLHLAAREGHAGIIERLLANGAAADARDSKGITPLRLAAWKGHTAVVKLLISHGADVNAKEMYSQTPLHYAAREGHTETVCLLLSHGAEINARKKNGGSAIDEAIASGQTETAALLLEHGATMFKESMGGTGLHSAAFRGNAAMAAMLLARDFNVNAKDETGATPLHHAIHRTWQRLHRGHRDVIELFLAHGADINARTSDGATPLDWAMECKRTNVVEFLRERGGKSGLDATASQPGAGGVDEMQTALTPHFTGVPTNQIRIPNASTKQKMGSAENGRTEMTDGSPADEAQDDESEQPEGGGHFAFQMEDRDLVEQLIAAVRLLFHRKRLIPAHAHRVAVVLLALDRLPLPTEGVDISLSLSRRVSEELSYQTLHISEDSFRLDAGGSVYSPEVGSDSYGDDLFEVEVGGGRTDPDWMAIADWLDQFRGRAEDEESELDFEWNGDESQIDWESGEPTEQRWDMLNNDGD